MLSQKKEARKGVTQPQIRTHTFEEYNNDLPFFDTKHQFHAINFHAITKLNRTFFAKSTASRGSPFVPTIVQVRRSLHPYPSKWLNVDLLSEFLKR